MPLEGRAFRIIARLGHSLKPSVGHVQNKSGPDTSNQAVYHKRGQLLPSKFGPAKAHTLEMRSVVSWVLGLVQNF
eukprot:8598212-Alexandrium_andersonii.AAC.1